MSTRNRIPSGIEPYLKLPPETSLILLTGTLGCSTNWLTALFISAILAPKSDAAAIIPESNVDAPCVLLVSWMRDLEFWKDQVRRTASVDIAKLSQQGRFLFLDCLNAANGFEDGVFSHVEDMVKESISKLHTQGESQPLIILDNPDVLLATSAATAQQLNYSIMRFRKLAQSVIISCSTDIPLVAASVNSTSRSQTPLEFETAGFLAQQAHAARFLMSVRELSTGAASDVSGVLRITKSGHSENDEPSQLAIQEREVLYLVQRDGNIKIFGRGEVSI